MTLHETEPQFFRRRQESRDRWPELGQVEPADLLAIDRLRLEEGRELTSFGTDVQQRYSDSLLEELGAPRGRLFDQASLSPFRQAEFDRFQQQQIVNRRVAGVSDPVSVPGTILSGLGRNVDRPRGAIAGFGAAEGGG